MSISQRNIINKLQAHLQKENNSLTVDKQGICNGLTIIQAKFYLEGREDEFFELIDKIVGVKSYDDNDDAKISKFCSDILIAFNPTQFGIYNYGQDDAYQLFSDKSHSFESIYKLGLETSDKDWAELFSKLPINDNEVMLVGGNRHAISIVKKKGEYWVYDPNHAQGYKVFSDENQLIQDLKGSVFGFEVNSNMALSIDIISRQEHDLTLQQKEVIAHRFPDKEVLLNQHNHDYLNSLLISCKLGDLIAVNKLLQSGNYDNPDNMNDAARHAALNGNTDILKNIFNHIDSNQKFTYIDFGRALCHAYTAAAFEGRKDCFDYLTTKGKEKKINFNQQERQLVFKAVCKGGNPDIIKDFFEKEKSISTHPCYSNNEKPSFSYGQSNEYDLMSRGVQSNNPSAIICIFKNLGHCSHADKLALLKEAINNESPLMIKTLVSLYNKQNFTKHEQLELLVEAIQTNSPMVVDTIIELYKFNHIDMTALEMNSIAIMKTNPSILEILQKIGVDVSLGFSIKKAVGLFTNDKDILINEKIIDANHKHKTLNHPLSKQQGKEKEIKGINVSADSTSSELNFHLKQKCIDFRQKTNEVRNGVHEISQEPTQQAFSFQ